MTFPINVNIPNTPNDPADDQPLMKQNYANIAGFLAVDHVAAGAIGAGFHKKITFNSENVPTLLPTDPVSIEFTANVTSVAGTVLNGLATSPASSIAQIFQANQNGVFPLNAIRAFASFTASTTVGAQTILNGFNVSGVTLDVTKKIYTISLQSGATNGANFVPIVINSAASLLNNIYTVSTAANTLTLTFATAVASTTTFYFVVLQV